MAPSARRARGACATLLLLALFTAAAATLAEVPYLGTVVCVAVLYLALGHRSLHDRARPVAAALSAGDEAEARRLVGLIVSRDPASLDITRAATESVLENGNDAVFGALFWFAVAGAPGVVVYHLAARQTDVLVIMRPTTLPASASGPRPYSTGIDASLCVAAGW